MPVWKLASQIPKDVGPSTVFLPCGRRWGKDRLAIWLCLSVGLDLLRSRGGSSLVPLVHQWVVAPTFGVSLQLWDEYLEFTKHLPRKVERSLHSRRITIMGGYVIQFKSTSNPDGLVGVGLDILHMTEAATVSDDAWDAGLKPTLTSPGRLGFSCINGTPGTHPSEWYQAIWRRAVDGDTSIFMVNQPSWDNEHLTTSQLEEIDKAAVELPERKFRTTYGAELIPEAGGVFRYVRRAHRGVYSEDRGHGPFTSFLDLGKKDFNTISTFHGTRQVYADRA